MYKPQLECIIAKSLGDCFWDIDGDTRIFSTNGPVYMQPGHEYYLLIQGTKILSFVKKTQPGRV